MANFATVNQGTPESPLVAFAGGAARFSADGTLRDSTQRCHRVALHLEVQHDGQDWDVIATLISPDQTFLFENLPAGDYRVRLEGADSVTSLTGNLS